MALVDDGPLLLLQPALPAATPTGLTTVLTAEMLRGESYRDAQAAEDGDGSDGSDGSDSPDSQHRDADKYKTELCRNWMQTGACPYNDRCQFAMATSTCACASSRRRIRRASAAHLP